MMGEPVCRTADIFPHIDPALVWSQMFHLSYSLNGGSGLHFTRADYLDMGLDEINDHLERLKNQRAAERRRAAKG